MTYFSRIDLVPAEPGVRRLLSSPQRMHAAVMRTCSGESEQPGRVLWRVDHVNANHVELYVVSPAEPSFASLTGWTDPAGAPAVTTRYSGFLDRLAAGQIWRFRLTANPVRNLPMSVGGAPVRGKVSPHITVDKQQNWLLKCAPSWGFSIVESAENGQLLQVCQRDRPQFSKSDGPKRCRVTVTRATFEGVLEITDAQAIRAALVNGCGRAKAYGCGLLTLAPVRRE